MKRQIKAVLRKAATPVHLVAALIHKAVPHNRRAGRIVVGVAVILIGAGLAQLEQHIIPRFVWDAIAWSIHGCGLSAIAERTL